MDSQDIYDENNNISSLVSSNKITIFSNYTDGKKTEEIDATSLELYQFEPVNANASNANEDEHHLMKS